MSQISSFSPDPYRVWEHEGEFYSRMLLDGQEPQGVDPKSVLGDFSIPLENDGEFDALISRGQGKSREELLRAINELTN